MALYRRLMPGRRIVGIDAESLARAGGDLRSLLITVPRAAPVIGRRSGHPVLGAQAVRVAVAARTWYK